MMQVFPRIFPVYMSSAMSLPFSDDPYCHYLSQQIGRYGPTVDLVSIEDVTTSLAKWSHTEDFTQMVMHIPHMPREESEIHIHKDVMDARLMYCHKGLYQIHNHQLPSM